MKLKRLTVIIALLALTVPVLLCSCNDNSGIIAEIWIENFNEDTDYNLLLRWTDVNKAIGYTVEYKYSLYPDAPVSQDVVEPGVWIARKRGTLDYRVKARFDGSEGEFSEWQSLTIKPLPLKNPDVTLSVRGDDLVISWALTEYKYLNDVRKVYSYEIVETCTYSDGEINSQTVPWIAIADSENSGVNELVWNNYLTRFEEGEEMTYTWKIKSLNTKYYTWYNDLGLPKQNEDKSERQYLYDIYEMPQEYAEKSISFTGTGLEA